MRDSAIRPPADTAPTTTTNRRWSRPASGVCAEQTDHEEQDRDAEQRPPSGLRRSRSGSRVLRSRRAKREERRTWSRTGRRAARPPAEASVFWPPDEVVPQAREVARVVDELLDDDRQPEHDGEHGGRQPAAPTDGLRFASPAIDDAVRDDDHSRRPRRVADSRHGSAPGTSRRRTRRRGGAIRPAPGARRTAASRRTRGARCAGSTVRAPPAVRSRGRSTR